jgi:hypothetical protein
MINQAELVLYTHPTLAGQRVRCLVDVAEYLDFHVREYERQWGWHPGMFVPTNDVPRIGSLGVVQRIEAPMPWDYTKTPAFVVLFDYDNLTRYMTAETLEVA